MFSNALISAAQSAIDAPALLNFLKEAIDSIFKRDCKGLSYKEIYESGYKLVAHGYGMDLYHTVNGKIEEKIKMLADSLKPSSEPAAFINSIRELWSSFNFSLTTTSEVLLYLEERFIKQNAYPSVTVFGYNSLMGLVFEKLQLLQRIQAIVLEMIAKDRSGELIDKVAVKDICQMLLTIDQSLRSENYGNYFEKPFLKSSGEFYLLDSQKALTSMAAVDYFKTVEQKVIEETERHKQYLNKNTEELMKNTLFNTYLSNKVINDLLKEGSKLSLIIQQDRMEDIERMHKLLKTNALYLNIFCEALQESILTEGNKILKENDQDPNKGYLKYIEGLFKLKEKYKMLWVDKCKRQPEFEAPIKKSFENFINSSKSTAQALAYYCNNILSKKAKNQEIQIDNVLEKIVLVFKDIHSKDVFEKFYGQMLARRLLAGSSASDDMERSFISRWKIEIGPKYTNNFEIMMKDIQQTTGELDKFQSSPHSERLPIKFTAKVLTQGVWPYEGKPTLCAIPPELIGAQNAYNTFYVELHSGRTLNWKLDKSEFEISARFDNGKHFELIMTTFQGVILLLFNYDKLISFQEIAEKTQIPPVELAKQIKSLLSTKVILYEKNEKEEAKEKGAIMDPNQQFKVNEQFACKFMRVHFPQPSEQVVVMDPSSEEVLTRDRCFVVDATIIKIMKSRKQVEHNTLVEDTIRLVGARFIINATHVRSRIEYLIESDYIERAEAERRLYVYKA